MINNTQLIIGLGNPGKQYESTRHNVGFMVVDALIDQLQPAEHQHNKNYDLWISEVPSPDLSARLAPKRATHTFTPRSLLRGDPALRERGGVRGRILLVKPLTFMNNSGEAVAELVRFFKIADEDVVVIHDDVDMSLGQVRFRQNGSSGGHNGVQSIIEALGHSDFSRIKIGIGRPPARVPTDAYVLQSFLDEEQNTLPQIIDAVRENVVLLVSNQKSFVEETISVEQ